MRKPLSLKRLVVRFGLLCGVILLLAGTAGAAPPIQQLTSKSFNVALDEWTEVEIGDKSATHFKPQARLKRWGDECWMDVKWLTTKKIPPVLDLAEGKIQKIKWRNSDKIELQFYPIDGYDLGGFEIEVILKEPPDSNKIVFAIETQGLSFHYQPPLTEEEINLGAIRPENVIGSYAVYHKNKEVIYTSSEEAHKYKVGKAFHIYRPKVHDAGGDSIWAELNIDNGYLTITVDQAWLDNANYPVTVDPTFGYETKGSASLEIANKIAGTAYTCGGSGNTDSMYVALLGWSADTKIKLAIYLKSTNALVDTSEERSSGGGIGYHVFDMPTSASVSATDYALVAWAHASVNVYYDAVSVYKYYQSIAYGAWPDPYAGTEGTGNFKYSIYCVYSEVGAPAGNPRRNRIIRQMLRGETDEEDFDFRCRLDPADYRE